MSVNGKSVQRHKSHGNLGTVVTPGSLSRGSGAGGEGKTNIQPSPTLWSCSTFYYTGESYLFKD